MAYTTVLSVGPAYTILQNVVYAMPAKEVRVHSTAAIEISPDGSTWDALTSAEGVGAEAASIFIRTTAASAIVTLKVA